MLRVDFIFDFASPNAYFCYKILPQIMERTGCVFDYKPVLLGGIFKSTNNQAPFFAFKDVSGKLAYEQLEITRFIKKHKLTKFTFNPFFPINTVKVMRAALVAERDRVLPAYIEAVTKAFWEEGKNMADRDVILGVLNEAGLDGAAMLDQSEMDDIKGQLRDNTAAAVARGAFGIPTFFVGEEMFFGKERLGQLEDEIIVQSG